MTPEERAELRAAELRLDAVEELENEHREELHEAGEHGERRDPYCVSCEHEVEDAKAEYAWMGRAVKSWTGGNPYSPTWTDTEGYVVEPLTNRGSLDAG